MKQKPSPWAGRESTPACAAAPGRPSPGPVRSGPVRPGGAGLRRPVRPRPRPAECGAGRRRRSQSRGYRTAGSSAGAGAPRCAGRRGPDAGGGRGAGTGRGVPGSPGRSLSPRGTACLFPTCPRAYLSSESWATKRALAESSGFWWIIKEHRECLGKPCEIVTFPTSSSSKSKTWK